MAFENPFDLFAALYRLNFGEPEKFKRLMATLTTRESKVIAYRFGLLGEPRLTISEIADKVYFASDYSKKFRVERVRQIEAKAIRKLSHPIRAAYFE